MEINELVNAQRRFFESGRTKEVKNRIEYLKKLKNEIEKREDEIGQALKEDLNKSGFESYMTEIGMIMAEISFVIKHLKGWTGKKRVMTPLAQFHAGSFVVEEPYGVVLIMSPWNYPFMLCMEPLVDAIAAGNCCVLKPSAYSPAVSAVIKKVIEAVFPAGYVSVVEGGREENSLLLEQRFDYIFFTGGVTVGKLVMEKAAAHLTPVTLELGGKSPCIVEKSADLKLAAKRLVFGKYLNAGQTCVAPDYLLVQKEVKDEFLHYVKESMKKQLGETPLLEEDYPKIINRKHFERLRGLMKDTVILAGGETDEERLRIAPTVLEGVNRESAIMKEEIFGPVLPVITFERLEEAEEFVLSYEKPLACYLFTRDKKVEKRLLGRLSFGGGCINDTIIHLATSRMGFGGVGGSGMGSYHGKAGFDTFSHRKSIVKKYNWIDLPIRYRPYTDMKKKLLTLFLR